MWSLNSATKIVLIMLIVAIILLNFLWIAVEEPLKTVTLMVVSFYFGQKYTTTAINDEVKWVK